MNATPHSIPWPDWLSQLRKNRIVSPIFVDPRTNQSRGTILGHTKEDILNEAIGWGQADFSESWLNISPADRALLYAYFNQRGHIDELRIAFHQLFHSHVFEAPPVLIDIGCGPFTAGLAFSSALPANTSYTYIGIDRASSMTDLGESLASAADQHVRCERIWAHSIKDVSWPYGASYREVITVTSYLMASPSLDVGQVVSDLTILLNKISLGSSCVLYTNSSKSSPNRRLPEFEEALSDAGFSKVINENGLINRSSRSSGQARELRYALYVRQELNILPLSKD